MATTYPNEYQQFPTMLNIAAVDAPFIQQYQDFIKAGNYIEAQKILESIPNYDRKIVTADLLNSLFDTNVAVQKFYTERYSPAYIVSENEPLGQEQGDFWFDVD